MKNFDFNNLRIDPSISGMCYFKTHFGGITIVLSAILTLFCCIAFGKEIWEKKNPTVNMSEQTLSDPILLKTDFVAALSATFTGGFAIPEIERYLHFQGVFSDTDGSRPTSNLTIFTPINVVNCTDLDLFKLNQDNIHIFIIGSELNYKCIDLGDALTPNISGVFGSSKFVTWSIMLNYCQNTTLNSNFCKSREEIQGYLQNLFVHLLMSSYYVDSNDLQRPIKKKYEGKLLKQAMTSYRRKINFFKNIEYFTDEGLMLDSSYLLGGYYLSLTQSEIFYAPDAIEIFRVTFTNANIMTIYHRSYTKLQNVTADIGGFNQVLLVNLNFPQHKIFYYCATRLLG